MKVLKVVCNILSGIIIALLLVLACVFFVPKIMGGESLAVLSGSMEPGIPVGSIVVASPVDTSEIKVNDIVTYRIDSTTLVTHRVIAINEGERTFTTKGDANETEDASPVPYENVVGRVKFHLPLIGYISMYIKTPLGIAGISAVVFVMIILLYLPDMFKPEEPKKEETKESKEIEDLDK